MMLHFSVSLLDLLFPTYCLSCHAYGQYLCPGCATKLKSLSVVYTPDSFLDAQLSLFKYKPPLSNLIHQLKYEFVSDSTNFISDLISTSLHQDFPNLLKYWQSENFTLVPIPLHWYRQNWRGYNQTQLISQHLSTILKLPTQELLIRSKYTNSQVSQKDKLNRLHNLDAAFTINPEHQSNLPQNIIIIDDVITTGATISQASQILKQHQVKSIWALSLAG